VEEIFDATLTAAFSTAPDDVQGFESNPPVVQQQLMATMLGNIAKMRHDMVKTVANNLRA
jgi:hypothetical protein